MAPHCPKRGDIVWIAFDPQSGHEQAGRRPAVALSPEAYNRKTGLALFCPISSREKGYAFEIKIPVGLKVSGVIISDQVKSMDWNARRSEFACHLPHAALTAVTDRISTLLSS